MPIRNKSDAAEFWIVAGAAGAGKTTLLEATNIERFGSSVDILDPDTLAANIEAREELEAAEAASEAFDRTLAWVKASIRAHRSVGVELDLSHAKCQRLMKLAQSAAFQCRLIYVVLDSADLNVARANLGALKGGPALTEDEVRSQRERSLKQLPWFLNQADSALVYDNSSSIPKLIGRKKSDVIEIDPSAPVAIKEAMVRLKVGIY